jgi:signal transduction histidine kinase
MPVAIEDLRRLLSEERERRQEMERLAQTREEFVHVLSHELRSPLTVMAGVLRFFEQRTPKGDVADLVASALQRAERLEHLVEGLELIGEGARPQTLSNVSAVVSEALAKLSLRPDRFEVADEPWPGVPSRHLARVAHELLENAVRHGRPPIEVQAYRQGSDGVLIVTDRGDSEPDPRLLEAFIQRDMSTTREQGGLGLGLFIASRLCDTSGGRLELRREHGRTVAEARFPLRD